MRHRTPRLLGVAILCAGLAFTGPTSYADGDPVALDGNPPASVIELGGPDRVQLTSVDESGHALLQTSPAPRPR